MKQRLVLAPVALVLAAILAASEQALSWTNAVALAAPLLAILSGWKGRPLPAALLLTASWVLASETRAPLEGTAVFLASWIFATAGRYLVLPVAVALWFAIDLRAPLVPGTLGYTWNALAATALLGTLVPLSLRPRLRDVAIGVATLLAFGAIAIPVGLSLSFLKGRVRLDLLATAIPQKTLAVALPEEAFFRGWLDPRLRERLSAPASLLLSSFLFGITHWNNASTTGAKISYCALATVAGIFYGLAARRSGNLVAAIIAHALVDVIWLVFLKK